MKEITEEVTKMIDRYIKKETYRDTAKEVKCMFDEFVAVGFSETQALELVKSTLIAGSIQNKQ